MRKPIIFLLILLTCYLGLVVYANRALYFSRFDEAYWKDKYEQSQWKLPLSKRTIGDDGLYLYEGYRLIRGGDPTTTNAEMPPLGKYLIGVSLVLFKNGYLFGFFTTTTLIGVTYLLAKKLLGHTTPALLVVLLLATDPLITNQYALTMMDALQVALLVLFVYFLFSINRPSQHRSLLTLITGVSLGLFAAAKPPILAPMIGTLGLWYLWSSFKKAKLLCTFALGVIFGYLLPYIPYFFQGHTVFDWLGIQKWMLSFYRHSNLTPTWGSVVTTLLMGKYQNIFSRMWETANEWSPSWALLSLSALAYFYTWVQTKKRDIQWGIIGSTILLTLGVYAIIPFWSRYIILVLPLLYLTGVKFLSRLSTRLMYSLIGILVTINIASSLPILFSAPIATINQFIYNTEHSFFADLYEDTTQKSRVVDRESFRRFAMGALADGEIEFINIEPLRPLPSSRQSPQYIDMTYTYFTRQLGTFSSTVTIPFVLEDNRWRIPWQWSYLLPGLTTHSTVETNVISARRGTIVASDHKPLAEDGSGVMVWITPGLIDKSREDELLSLLEQVYDGILPKVAIHQRIVGNTLPDRLVPIGVIPHPPNDARVIDLSHYPGVTFTQAPTRLTHPNNVVDVGNVKNSLYAECCSFLYSTSTYDGVSGVEKDRNTILKGYNGGSLVLKNEQGTILKTFISREKIDGKDVQP